MKSGTIVIGASGAFELPGGLCGRVVSATPAVPINFPLVGYIDDGRQTKFVMLDNGPHPFTELDAKRGVFFAPKIVFPNGTLPQGTIIAYFVAETEFEARFMQASGLQLAQDSAGRVVVIGADSPSKATYLCTWAVATAGNFCAIVPTAKKVRLRRFRFDWPGRQTTGATALFRLWLDKTHVATGVSSGVTANPADPTNDAGPSSSFNTVPGTKPTGTASLLWSGFLWIPAADGPFQPIEIDFERPLSGQKPPIVPVGGCLFWDTGGGPLDPGAGYDGLTKMSFVFTEE